SLHVKPDVFQWPGDPLQQVTYFGKRVVKEVGAQKTIPKNFQVFDAIFAGQGKLNRNNHFRSFFDGLLQRQGWIKTDDPREGRAKTPGEGVERLAFLGDVDEPGLADEALKRSS